MTWRIFNKVVKLWLKCVIDFRQTIGHRDACENSQERFLSLVKIPTIQWKHGVMPSLHTHSVHYSIHPNGSLHYLVGKTFLENHSTTSGFPFIFKNLVEMCVSWFGHLNYISKMIWTIWNLNLGSRGVIHPVRSTTSFMSMVYDVYFWYPPGWSSIRSTKWITFV